jgi:hypothetical protein
MRGLPDLAAIEGLGRKIERWRQGRPKSLPMPEALWQEATAAARKLGTGRVARALGLGYEGLKQRVLAREAGRRAAPRETVLASQFVELPSLPVAGSDAGGEGLLLEMVATDGTRLTIRTREANPGVLAVIQAFRGRS